MSVNQKIGDYTVVKTVGSGSFGKVKQAVHNYTKQVVALKVINRSKLVHSDMAGRVNREIQYLKMLRHPHIIKLYEVISTPTDIIMVIEFAGGELFNYLVEKGRMSESNARKFFQQIIAAVEYSHRRGIVHSLLLDPFDNVKVADFGLSNIIKDGEFLKTSCGSPNYAAPEVINGKLYAGPDVDVWSCGVILYVMLCGKLPFDDDNIPSLFKKISSGIFVVPSYVSPEAKHLIQQMLVVDPTSRITIPEIRKNKWFNVDLPDYLQPLPEGVDPMQLEVMNNDIVSDLVTKLQLPRSEVNSLLRVDGTNFVKVSYQLLLDNKHMIERSKLSESTGIKNFSLSTSPPVWNAVSANVLLNHQNPLDAAYGRTLHSPGFRFDSNNNPENDQINQNSSISVLSSSIPKSSILRQRDNAGHPDSKGQIVPGRVKIEDQSNITKAVLANNAARNSPHLPGKTNDVHSPEDSTLKATKTPSNYFRAQLPPLPQNVTNVIQSAGQSPNSESSIESIRKFYNEVSERNKKENAHRLSQTQAVYDEPGPFRGGNHYAADFNTSGDKNGLLGVPSTQGTNHTGNSPGIVSSSLDHNNFYGHPLHHNSNKAFKDTSKTRPRWHFGIRSKSQPAEVMNEIYKTLSALDMKWKAFDPYHIRIKYVRYLNDDHKDLPNLMPEKFGDNFKFGSSGNSESIFNTGSKRKSTYGFMMGPGNQHLHRGHNQSNLMETRVDLQLYRVDQKNYLVDFRAVVPPAQKERNHSKLEPDLGTVPLVPDPVDVASVSIPLPQSLTNPGSALRSLYGNNQSIANVNFESLRVSEKDIPPFPFKPEQHDPEFVFDSEIDSGEKKDSSNFNNQVNNLMINIDIPGKPRSMSLVGDKPLPVPSSLPGFENVPFGSKVKSLAQHEVTQTELAQSLRVGIEPQFENELSARDVDSNRDSISGIGINKKEAFKSESPFGTSLGSPKPDILNIAARNFANSPGTQYMVAPSSFRSGSIQSQKELIKGLVINKSTTDATGQVFDIFPFFEVCARLISRLAVPQQKS
ncbi:hypothetical protein BB560_006353 [Smittium megazygosporum]|uniref:non-specific serine/threonine protein kinase n=1 Tax=Smittium megazygosporum TaxID=133381 RepID=A0A2T9Y8N0_9FUNG|nr:hypothetical protein BB560_006353 [Smittium megazygosporum]